MVSFNEVVEVVLFAFEDWRSLVCGIIIFEDDVDVGNNKGEEDSDEPSFCEGFPSWEGTIKNGETGDAIFLDELLYSRDENANAEEEDVAEEEEDDDDHITMGSRGWACEQTNRGERALSFYERALQRSSETSSTPYVNLAQYYMKRNRLDDAEHMFREAVCWYVRECWCSNVHSQT